MGTWVCRRAVLDTCGSGEAGSGAAGAACGARSMHVGGLRGCIGCVFTRCHSSMGEVIYLPCLQGSRWLFEVSRLAKMGKWEVSNKGRDRNPSIPFFIRQLRHFSVRGTVRRIEEQVLSPLMHVLQDWYSENCSVMRIFVRDFWIARPDRIYPAGGLAAWALKRRQEGACKTTPEGCRMSGFSAQPPDLTENTPKILSL